MDPYTCPANQPQTPASNRIDDRIDRIELARYRSPLISHLPPVGGWEVGGGKSEDRRRSLEIESIHRCRSNRFGHGMFITVVPI